MHHPENKPCWVRRVPELTPEGIQNLFRVATGTEDSVMQSFWPDIEANVTQHLDLFSDDQLRTLLRIPYWENVINQAESSLSPETQTRIDALRPRSAIGKLLHAVCSKFRSWSLPAGITPAEANSVLREYHARVSASGSFLMPDERIAIMNEIVTERFPDLDEKTNRIVRFYFYHRENFIGAN